MSSPWYRPQGPFRPLRRLAFWATIATFVLAVLGFAFGAPGPAFVLSAFVLPWLFVACVGLWFVDMVLAYIKDDPAGSGEPPTSTSRP